MTEQHRNNTLRLVDDLMATQIGYMQARQQSQYEQKRTELLDEARRRQIAQLNKLLPSLAGIDDKGLLHIAYELLDNTPAKPQTVAADGEVDAD